MCGKYPVYSALRWIKRGSPPHVREVHVIYHFLSLFVRITPACAGSTRKGISYDTLVEDHPRMCGKYSIIKLLVFVDVWITPACAGST